MCTQSGPSRRLALAPEQTSLAVFGAVRSPRFFSWADLCGLPRRVRRATLICAAAPLDARRWETRYWSGVSIPDLLAAANAPAEARSIEVAGYDGSLTSFPLLALNHALLALAADDQPLSMGQGAPVRLIVPGLSACDMPRFVQRIRVSTEAAETPRPGEPYAVLERAEPDAGSFRLTGLVFAAQAVAVRLDDGPPVRVDVDATDGIAGEWSLVWPGRLAAGQSFTVEPWSEGAERVSEAARPLARRWKPRAQRWTIPLEREP